MQPVFSALDTHSIVSSATASCATAAHHCRTAWRFFTRMVSTPLPSDAVNHDQRQRCHNAWYILQCTMAAMNIGSEQQHRRKNHTSRPHGCIRDLRLSRSAAVQLHTSTHNILCEALCTTSAQLGAVAVRTLRQCASGAQNATRIHSSSPCPSDLHNLKGVGWCHVLYLSLYTIRQSMRSHATL